MPKAFILLLGFPVVEEIGYRPIYPVWYTMPLDFAPVSPDQLSSKASWCIPRVMVTEFETSVSWPLTWSCNRERPPAFPRC